tara:strand:- start:9014 stop:9706 length:693 start_codon:yes stop_codon:yes gene_type:complete
MLAPAEAKLFQNSYVKFELPDNWQCQMQQTEWICRSSNRQSAREAIIILTAKEVSPQDTLTNYENYLRKPKVSVNSKGKSIPATLKKLETRKIKNMEWVDGLLLGSEIPNFYTRYLATVKSKVAVLVTFTAHQRHYTKYSRDFFQAIESLEVVATDALLNRSNTLRGAGTGSLISSDMGGIIPPDMLEEGECFEGEDCYEDASASNEWLDYALVVSLLLLAVGAYMVLKK